MTAQLFERPHIAPNGLTSEALAGGGSREYQACVACGTVLRELPKGQQRTQYAKGARIGTDCPGKKLRRQEASEIMPTRKAQKKTLNTKAVRSKVARAKRAVKKPTPVEHVTGASSADDAPTHLARCAEPDCDAGVLFRQLPSGSGFAVIERYGVDVETTFGVSDHGLPLCPYGHGAMLLADEQVAASDAIAQAADAVNGNGDAQQIPLIDTTKPFNLAGAFTAIAEKNRAVTWAHDAYETAKDDAAQTRKTWEREAKQLQELIDDLARKQKAKDKQIASAEEATQEASGAAVGDATTETVGTSVEPAIVEPAAAGREDDALAHA